MKKLFTLALATILLTPFFVEAAVIPTSWYRDTTLNLVKPLSPTDGLMVPGLATSTTGCLGVDSSGWISASGSACGSGGGNSFAFPWTARSYGNSTSTTLGFLNGFLSTASSTINAPLRLTGITGLLYGGTGGLVGSTATGTVSSGTGISVTAGQNIIGSGLTITNTAPDQTVVLTQGGATTITGTYPNFTISSTDSTASSTLLSDNNTWTGTNAFNGTFTLGSPLTVANGGTGASTLTGLLVGNGTSAFTAISGTTCTNQFLRAFTSSGGTCATVALDTDVSGFLSVGNLEGGTTNTVLTTNGADIVAWAKLALGSQVQGTLPIANGGTNSTSLTNNTLLWFNGTSITSTSSHPLTLGFVTATSTTASSTLPRISATGIGTSWLCLSTDCRTTWPTGGSPDNSTWSTTTSSVPGQLINYPDNDTDIVAIGGNSTSTAKVYVDPNKSEGRMGIGTSSPSQRLSVQGNTLISGNLSAANLIATGTLTVESTGTSTVAGNLLIGGDVVIEGDLEVEGSLWPLIIATIAAAMATYTLTFTNKRITPRIGTTTSSATPSINTDNVDQFTITALATNITSMTTNLSGTPTDGQKLIIRFLDNGTARTIAWGASFASRGATLPTTTVISKYLWVGLIWNSQASTWDCVASAQEA